MTLTIGGFRQREAPGMGELALFWDDRLGEIEHDPQLWDSDQSIAEALIEVQIDALGMIAPGLADRFVRALERMRDLEGTGRSA